MIAGSVRLVALTPCVEQQATKMIMLVNTVNDFLILLCFLFTFARLVKCRIAEHGDPCREMLSFDVQNALDEANLHR